MDFVRIAGQVNEAASADASAEAAAVQAAYRMLALRYPSALATLDAARANSLAAIAGGPSKDAGIALGDSVAQQIYALRINDHINDPGPAYVYGSGPAAYQPTPPNFPVPVNTGAQSWIPFALTSANQFRPDAPYSVTSRAFARDYNETKTYGTACPDPLICARTADQSQTALWHSEQGHVQFNRVAGIVSEARGLDLVAGTRLFALLNLALMDAVVVVFDAKYQYNFVRPITAIRNGDADGNSRTAGDAMYSTFMITPPHPEYPAAHTTQQTAGATVLNKLIGRHVGVDTTSTGVPGVTRHFDSFNDFIADGFVACIYGGMHFRTSLEVGHRIGKETGKFILKNMLKRVRGDHDDDNDEDDNDE